MCLNILLAKINLYLKPIVTLFASLEKAEDKATQGLYFWTEKGQKHGSGSIFVTVYIQSSWIIYSICLATAVNNESVTMP